MQHSALADGDTVVALYAETVLPDYLLLQIYGLSLAKVN
jgi:hypothetical protein